MAKLLTDVSLKAEWFTEGEANEVYASPGIEAIFKSTKFKNLEIKPIRANIISKINASEATALTLAFLQVGVNYPSWKDSMFVDKDAYTNLTNIIKKLDMVRNKSQVTDAKPITPNRFLLALGDFVIKIISAMPEANQRELVKGFVPAGMPLAYAWSGAASFLPMDSKIESLYTVWAISFDYTITKEEKKSEWSFDEAYTRVAKYVRIGVTAKVSSPEAKLALWKLPGNFTGKDTPGKILSSLGGTGDFEKFIGEYGLKWDSVTLKSEKIKKLKKRDADLSGKKVMI